MSSYNHVVLMGNLTRDVQVRQTPNGASVCDLGIAVNERVKRGDQWVDEATFVDVTFFGKTAEIAGQYLTKGSQILIDGRLKLESWEKDGAKVYKLKVIGNRMQMLGKGSGRPTNSDDAPSGAEPPMSPDDDIPF